MIHRWTRTLTIFAFLCASFGFIASNLEASTSKPGAGLDYARIDRHSLEAPPEAEESIALLADYLSKVAQSDHEKARAIYRWVAEHIEYDIDRSFKGPSFGVVPESVLKTRTAVCSGYTGVFKSLADEMGLESVEIRGHVKGTRYKPGHRFRGPFNHSWNAVKFDGEWHLVDSTWGAGYFDETGQYVYEFDDYYFMAPAEELIFSHFPEDKKWQLLDKSVSLEEFEKWPYVKPVFHRLGLGLSSHTNGLIMAQDSLTLTLKAPKGISIQTVLKEGGRSLGASWLRGKRRGGEYQVTISFPYPGFFSLNIFVKEGGGTGPFDLALQYKVQATGIKQD